MENLEDRISLLEQDVRHLKTVTNDLLSLALNGIPSLGHEGPCSPEAGCDGACMDVANCVRVIMTAQEELKKVRKV